jgi:hypothetical protein
MLFGVDVEHMSKGKIIEKLSEACCPVLEKLAEK